MLLRSYSTEDALPAGTIERVATLRATSRDHAWEIVKASPDTWLKGLEPDKPVRLALLPQSQWPAFEELTTRARLELA